MKLNCKYALNLQTSLGLSLHFVNALFLMKFKQFVSSADDVQPAFGGIKKNLDTISAVEISIPDAVLCIVVKDE